MLPSFDTRLESSVFLWLDNVLCSEASGFSNFAGNFTQTTGNYGGWKSYASPYRQALYDNSISGAVIPSGVYANGVFQPTGSTKMLDFNQGQFISTTNLAAPVSGAFSFKEVNLYFTNEPEEVVIFEQKYQANPRHAPAFTGYYQTDQVYPLIFIKYQPGKNKLVCFDGINDTTPTIRLIVMADTPYLYRSICGRLRDKKDTWLPIFDVADMPFNQFGCLKAPFNYAQKRAAIQADPSKLALITDVSISDIPSRVTTQLQNVRLFAGFIDLELSVYRIPGAG